MYHTRYCVLMTLLTLTACAHGPDDSPAQGEPRSSGKQYSTIYDVFSTHDSNGDGYLDHQEFHQLQNDEMLIAMRQKIPSMRSDPLIFQEIDENMDDRLSMEEVTRVIFPLLPRQ